MQLDFGRELGVLAISANAEVLLAATWVLPSQNWSQHLALNVLGQASLFLAVFRRKSFASKGRSRAFVEGGWETWGYNQGAGKMCEHHTEQTKWAHVCSEILEWDIACMYL